MEKHASSEGEPDQHGNVMAQPQPIEQPMHAIGGQITIQIQTAQTKTDRLDQPYANHHKNCDRKWQIRRRENCASMGQGLPCD
jgi:hypothetical protein